MFEGKHIDELIEDRRIARENKEWKLSDDIRNYLDEKFIFIFDVKGNDGKPFQEVHYLYNEYFNRMESVEGMENLKFKSKRDFLEWKIKQNIQSEKRFDAWLYSTLSSK